MHRQYLWSSQNWRVTKFWQSLLTNILLETIIIGSDHFAYQTQCVAQCIENTYKLPRTVMSPKISRRLVSLWQTNQIKIMENTIFIPFVYLECKFLAGLVDTLLHFAVHTVTKNLGLDPAQHFHQSFYPRFFLICLTYKSLRLGQCWISKASSWSLQLRRANWRPGNAGKISIHLAFVDKLMTQGPICKSWTETLMPVFNLFWFFDTWGRYFFIV